MSLEGVLSMAEADQAVVIGQVAETRLRQGEAARRLGMSVRQVRRLLARYRERGPAGLVSGHRGKVSNNATPAANGVRKTSPTTAPPRHVLEFVGHHNAHSLDPRTSCG